MTFKNKLTIIAEVGSVHDGSIGNALRLIDAASECGANVVKFQTHIPEAESLVDAPSPAYFNDEPRFDYFKRTSFSLNEWRRISKHCDDVGIGFLSSPFSLEAVDILEAVDVSLYKIPSGEVTNSPLLERISKTGKPTYLSSGMSSWSELDQAVSILRSGGPLTVMQCTSAYPCAPKSVGLNIISEMHNRYGLDVGFSDHTLGFAASIGAVVLGANVVEKHFTFSKLMYGSDAKHSMEPVEFKRYCQEVSEAFIMREYNVDKDDLSPFSSMKDIFEKSIVLSRPLKNGAVLTFEDLSFKKPGDGIKAARYLDVIGRIVSKDLPKDNKLNWEDLI
jgi:N,N'-diacetyllegionaminate synthase